MKFVSFYCEIMFKTLWLIRNILKRTQIEGKITNILKEEWEADTL
jgi:hypothetical protein